MANLLLDEVTDHVEVRYENAEGETTGYSGVNIDINVDLDLGFLLEVMSVDDIANYVVDGIIVAMSNKYIEPELNTVLLSDKFDEVEEEGYVLEIIEEVMDVFYHIQPCGGFGGILPSLPSFPFASREFTVNVAANAMTYLMPFGWVFFYRRRRKK